MERKNLGKVLLHSIVFSPDAVSTAYLYNDIALGLVESGFNVVVLSTTPHYNLVESELIKQPLKKKLFGLYYLSDFRGIKVYHIPLKRYKSTLWRLLSFAYWHLSSLLIGFSIKKINYILSPSPPLSIGLISLILAKIKSAKFIYNVQEIYPDLLINQGNIKSSIIIKFLRKIESIIYNYSTAVTTIDEAFYSKISSRFINSCKLKVIPNFVDTDLYRPLKCNLTLPPIFEKNNSKIKALYAGNIGYFQDWDPVLFAAEQLRNENIEFWIIGDGAQKAKLEAEIRTRNISNIFIFPYQDRVVIPSINNYVDIHFITINSNLEQEGFPSKVYTILACAKPLVVVTGVGSPLYNFLYNKNCSEIITNNRNINFTNAIRKLANDKNLREKLGNNGYHLIKSNYSKLGVVSKYVKLLQSL